MASHLADLGQPDDMPQAVAIGDTAPQRLLANPTAQTYIACQEQLERQAAPARPTI